MIRPALQLFFPNAKPGDFITMPLDFNPRQLPVPMPRPASGVIHDLAKKFIGAFVHDIRAASAPIANEITSHGEISGNHRELTVEMVGDHGGITVAGEEHEDGTVSMCVAFTCPKGAPLAAFLDLAAAGLAAMDTHAIQNDWHKS